VNDYMKRYREWRDSQKCIGCGLKSGEHIAGYKPDEKCWVHEYLCEPCWDNGVRGVPEIMFDGESGSTYRTS
jgi:hypothetical protein